MCFAFAAYPDPYFRRSTFLIHHKVGASGRAKSVNFVAKSVKVGLEWPQKGIWGRMSGNHLNKITWQFTETVFEAPGKTAGIFVAHPGRQYGDRNGSAIFQ